MSIYKFPLLSFYNLGVRSVFATGEEAELSRQELELLEALIRNRNIALSRERLLDRH